MATDPSQFDLTARPKGEVNVWLTAAGLALGVLMIVGLLSLVLWEGVRVFWPDPVVEIQLQEGSTDPADRNTLAGAIVRTRPKTQSEGEEWQLFLGNKDIYGLMFRYVDADDIVSLETPDDIVVAERMEYGDAIFYPVALSTEDGERIDASHAEFFEIFGSSLHTIAERRETIHDIERKAIGRINRKMEALRLEQRQLAGSTEPIDTDRLADIEERLADFQERYEVLASEARELRTQQTAGSLEYRLSSGEIRALPLGQFVRFHRPNQMGFLDKIGYFFAEIWRFLSENPREANTEGGIFPALFGTFVVTIMMSAAVMPFGVLAAIYLREYARQGPFVRMVRTAVNNLAGVPSIVFGVFGLGFFVYFLGGSIDELLFSERLPQATFGTGGILWASLTLALMTVPVVVVSTEEALAAVPRGVREASIACGASKWQTIQHIVLPQSAPGILTGLILAMARGAGEVAPLMLIGVVKLAPSLPLDGVYPFLHLDRKFMHLGFHIFDLGFQSPDSEAARPMVFASTLLLITLVVVLNLGAILLRNHLRKKYTSSAF